MRVDNADEAALRRSAEPGEHVDVCYADKTAAIDGIANGSFGAPQRKSGAVGRL